MLELVAAPLVENVSPTNLESTQPMSYVCPPKQTKDKLNLFFFSACRMFVGQFSCFVARRLGFFFCGGNFKDSNQDFPSRQLTVSDGKHVYVILLTLGKRP